MSADAPVFDLCDCDGFVLWYVDCDGPALRVCWCGHSETEHLDGVRSCVGEIRLFPADQTGGETA